MSQSMSYAELGQALKIAPTSAYRLALRRRWPRTRGNDGKARIEVPDEVFQDRAVTPDVAPDNLVHQLQARVAELERDLAGVRGELSGVREALVEAKARANAAEARDSYHTADLFAERANVEKAIQAFGSLADRLDALAAANQRQPFLKRLKQRLVG